MGIIAAKKAQYENAIRKLFPQGAYWDEQFSDPGSDVSIFIKAKADELIRFKGRMSDLYNESHLETTEELIDDWERVLLDESNIGKTLDDRRQLLKSKEDNCLNRAILKKIAEIFELNILDITIPYRPRFFGFAQFARERLGSFTTFSVLRIVATEAGIEAKHWQMIKTELEECRFFRIRFAHKRMAYYPINKMREIVCRKISRGCFGYGRFAYNRLTPFPMNDYIAEILRTADFYKRFEHVLLDEYFTRIKPYCEFEEAIRNKLLVNQIPIFNYGGE